MNATYTNSLEPSIEANIITGQPSEDPEDDLEAIQKELTNWEDNAVRLDLLKLALDFGKDYTTKELKALKEQAEKKAEPFSPTVRVLVEAFWIAAISYSMSLAEKEKDCRQDPCNESEPAAKSERITHRQDDSISYGQ